MSGTDSCCTVLNSTSEDCPMWLARLLLFSCLVGLTALVVQPSTPEFPTQEFKDVVNHVNFSLPGDGTYTGEVVDRPGVIKIDLASKDGRYSKVEGFWTKINEKDLWALQFCPTDLTCPKFRSVNQKLEPRDSAIIQEALKHKTLPSPYKNNASTP